MQLTVTNNASWFVKVPLSRRRHRNIYVVGFGLNLVGQAHGVDKFPTIVIFKDGKPVNRQVGLSVTSLIKALKEHGANLEVRLRVTAELLFH